MAISATSAIWSARSSGGRGHRRAITLEDASRDMTTEAVSAGLCESLGWGKKFQRIQILTVQDLLSGRGVDAPPMYGAFKQAERVPNQGATQFALDI